jgi:hypothetical protein
LLERQVNRQVEDRGSGPCELWVAEERRVGEGTQESDEVKAFLGSEMKPTAGHIGDE